MANQGWIKFDREEMDDEVIWDTDEPYDRRSAWVYLLAIANHEAKNIRINNSVKEIKRGQHYTSIRKLAEKWNWSEGRVRRYLKLLSEEGKIVVESNAFGTLLTLVKYEDSQGQRHTDEYTHEHTHKHTDGSRMNTRSVDKQEDKNIKNDKEDKNIEPSAVPSEEDDDDWLSPEECGKICEEMKKQSKE